ncbi:ribosome recycling factor [Patescibacteria group bacterium]
MTSSELKNRLTKSIEFLQAELTQIRTGRANPSLLEDIQVVAYEATMTLKELGSITLADAQTIMVTPWDKNLIPDIEKAIRESEAKLNPVEVGGNLKVPVPPLTEDRRKELVRLVNQKVEDCKQSVRNIRQDAMKDIDKEFEDKIISEDEKFTQKEEAEEIAKDFVEQSDAIGETKSSELMTV